MEEKDRNCNGEGRSSKDGIECSSKKSPKRKKEYGEEDNSTVIFGTKGLMRIYDNSEHTIQISTDRGDKIYYDLDMMMTNTNQRESGVIREFIRELESGEWTNAADDRSVNALRAVLASFQSSQEDRTIKL